MHPLSLILWPRQPCMIRNVTKQRNITANRPPLPIQLSLMTPVVHVNEQNLVFARYHFRRAHTIADPLRLSLVLHPQRCVLRD